VSTHRKFLIVFAGTLLLIAVVTILYQDREPRYKGRNLSSWLKDLDEDTKKGEAEAAVKAIGPESLPFLLNWSYHWWQMSESTRMAYRFAGMITPRLGQIIMGRWEATVRRASHAQYAITLLGDQAQAAIPALTKRLTTAKPDTLEGETMQVIAGNLLASLAPRGLPPLLSALTNKSASVRYAAAESLHLITTEKEKVIPQLIHALHDTNSAVVNAVLTSLNSYAIDPAIAVPAFTECLQSTNERTRELAAFHLGVYHRDARPAASRLMGLLSDPDANVRKAATNAVVLIAPKALTTGQPPSVLFDEVQAH